MKTSTTISLGAALLLNLAALAIRSHAAPGDVDLSFDPGSGVNGQVISMVVQPDGKALIGGMFTTVRGAVRNRIARLNADGTVDFTFNPPDLNFTVNSVALQPDGKVLIAEGLLSGTIVRLNADGTWDTSFNPDIGAKVNSVVLQGDGKVLIGGIFTSVGGTARNRIARLNTDGTLDSSFNPGTGASGEVLAVATQPDGKALVAGLFTSINGTARNRIARLNTDGSVDTSFDPGTGASGAVRSIAVQPDGTILIGGDFSSVGGTARSRIARLNTDGSLDTLFNPGTGASSTVYSVALQPDGKMLIGGSFTSVDGTARNRIARLNANGSLDTVFNPGAGASDWVRTIVVQSDEKIMIGGSFLSVAGTMKVRVARLNADGGLDPTFDPGAFVSGTVRAVAPQADGKVLVAGEFTSVNGGLRNRIARLNADGTSDFSFDPGAGANDRIYALAIQPDGKALIGGTFTSVADTTRNRIARLNVNGSLDISFNPGSGADGDIFSLALQPDGKILVAGLFWSINGVARNQIARLNADGSLDTSFNPGTGTGNYFSVAIQADGKVLITGDFSSVNGTPRSRIARLNANGTLDTGFNPGTGATAGSSTISTYIFSVAVQPDGKVLVGGDFTLFNGTARNGLARLNANGSLDTSFNPGLGVSGGYDFPAVYSVMRQPDGKILIGGDFTSFNGSSRSGIARLNIDGSLDASFNPGVGANNLVFSVATQADGKILIGGEFTSVNNVARNYVVRLHADYLPSRLEISSGGGLPTLQLTGEVGQQYFLEYASALPTASNAWTALPSLTLTNSPQTVFDATAANAPQRFYRARRLAQ